MGGPAPKIGNIACIWDAFVDIRGGKAEGAGGKCDAARRDGSKSPSPTGPGATT